MPLRRFTAQNRCAWDEIAEMRAQALWPAADFFAQGGSLLNARTVTAAGDVRDLTLCHLQCATGEETLSWANHGATVTGIDISPKQIALAQQKVAAAGIDAHFIAADVYDLPPTLPPASFDIVFTGGGALVWLPDLPRWAQTVARLLKPGGRLLLDEEHPVAGCLAVDNGQLHLSGDYFGRKPEIYTGWSHFPGGEAAHETKVEFAWPLGDVVTSLAQAGLRITALTEYPSEAEWRFQEKLADVATLPGCYLLIAEK